MTDSVYVTQVICLYWVVSISMVYLNKILLSSEEASIPAPLFVTWYQCIITAAICYFFGLIGERTRKLGVGSYFDSYPLVRYNFRAGLGVLPLSLIFVGMITFNNVCLKYVEVSFYNVARSLSIVFNVIFTFLVLGKTTSWSTCLTLLVVIYGFYIGIEGETNFSLFGTAAGVISSVFVSLNSIFTAKVLPLVNEDKSLLLYYNNVNGMILFLPLIIIFEKDIILDNADKLTSLFFWFVMTITGKGD